MSETSTILWIEREVNSEFEELQVEVIVEIDAYGVRADDKATVLEGKLQGQQFGLTADEMERAADKAWEEWGEDNG